MKPTTTLTPDGQAYDLNPTAVLLILADTVFGEGRYDTTPYRPIPCSQDRCRHAGCCQRWRVRTS
jgi:hypothetical protein